MTADLFGFESPTTRRTNNRPEAAALAEVLRVLRHHPAVAWVERENFGVARMGGRLFGSGGVAFVAKDCRGVLRELSATDEAARTPRNGNKGEQA